VITGIVLAMNLADFERNLSVVSTTMLGILFAGLGYILRPKPTTTVAPTTTAMAFAPPPPPPPVPEPQPLQIAVPETQPVVEQQIEVVAEATVPSTPELMKVKGIGEKRAKQLSDMGISSIEGLSKASAKEIAAQLKISPKITEKWVANAKELVREG
jgi:predicted flap endonuclease-1-like 5' DNA nuclease